MIHTLKLNLIKNPARVLTVVMAVAMIFMTTLGISNTSAQDGTNKDLACQGVGLASGGGDCDQATDATGTISSIVEQIVRILIIVTGAVAVIMIIVGGFRYIISAGDGNAAAAAKKTIVYALVGLVIVIFAQIIVSLVANTANDAAAGTGGGEGGE